MNSLLDDENAIASGNCEVVAKNRFPDSSEESKQNCLETFSLALEDRKILRL
jgi:hypothetical protein